MRVGMLGRFFAGNWRPPADEIQFAAVSGFDLLQIRSDHAGGIADVLRAVPLILEIGGLPISGGPGFDTDEPLLDSLAVLRRALN